MNKPKAVQGMVYRLTPEVYSQLEEKLLSDVLVNKETTDLQAGYMLGIQKVLKVLRDGFTIARTD